MRKLRFLIDSNASGKKTYCPMKCTALEVDGVPCGSPCDVPKGKLGHACLNADEHLCMACLRAEAFMPDKEAEDTIKFEALAIEDTMLRQSQRCDAGLYSRLDASWRRPGEGAWRNR